MAHILVVDDEKSIRQALVRLLRKNGYQTEESPGPQEALERLQDNVYEIIISDIRMPGMDGLEFLKRIKALSPETAVIMITAYGSIEVAVDAMSAGAFHFITKPFRNAEIKLAVERALQQSSLIKENQALKDMVGEQFASVISSNQKMKEVFELVKQVARTDAPVLVEGESGTGKELIAKAIHYNSLRKSNRFVVINCSALPDTLLEAELFGHVKGAFTDAHAARKGLFEEAHGGTIFLDEIGETSQLMQVKLLRVLQEGEYRPVGSSEIRKTDFRLISATNRCLKDEIAEKRFREDLYYRLNVVNIVLPPLRERADDIPLLSYNFLNKYAAKNGKNVSRISEEAMELLQSYQFPGNVRELENLMERAVILAKGSEVDTDCLPREIITGLDSNSRVPESYDQLKQAKERFHDEVVSRLETSFVTEALRKSGGNVSNAARDVGMDRANFQKIMRKYGIKSDDFRI